MIQIHAIEISYFRSIYKLRLKNLADLNVLAGKNDRGKSNVLKALNLFFNNEPDWQTPLDFSRDFNRRRLAEVRLETIKGRQFIQIQVDFTRGSRFEKSLPERFSVTKTWFRDSSTPEQRASVSRQFSQGKVLTKNRDRALASMQRYLGTIHFEYVPAIKDRSFFAYILGRLQDVIFEQSEGAPETAKAVQNLNSSVEREAADLHEEFGKAADVPIRLRLPAQLGDLFRAFSVATQQGTEEFPLEVRGDGIRARFLPSLLHYVSQHSPLQYVWGFEEPENSLEHGLATRLAADIRDSYSIDTQVFVTTHSPAFFSLESDRVRVFRVLNDGLGTSTELLEGAAGDVRSTLHGDLGLLELQRQFQKDYEKQVSLLLKAKKRADDLQLKIGSLTKPVLLVEGKWDTSILGTAWKRLESGEACPFEILSCSTVPQDEEAGGVGTLKIALEAVRPDQVPTIGLFDRDRAGADRGFGGLNANFRVEPSEPSVKYQRAGCAAAILLPPVSGREKYADALNFPLEFYFAEKFLKRRVNGRGLVLRRATIERTVVGTGLKIGKATAPELHLRQIEGNSKKAFASDIVPTLPGEAFQNFIPLFKLLKAVLAQLKRMRAAKK